MTVTSANRKTVLPVADYARRKRYLSATFVICFVLLAIGITLYVVNQGFDRMGEMRTRVTYELKDESSHIRAAGEDLVLHSVHEAEKKHAVGYNISPSLLLARCLYKISWGLLPYVFFTMISPMTPPKAAEVITTVTYKAHMPNGIIDVSSGTVFI